MIRDISRFYATYIEELRSLREKSNRLNRFKIWILLGITDRVVTIGFPILLLWSILYVFRITLDEIIRIIEIFKNLI